jgi:Reductase C-terminal
LLQGSGLAAGFWGVGCDAGCRAFDINGVVTDSIFVVGDIARFPHVLYEYQFLVLEHWDNAVLGAEVAAHNMVSLEPDCWPHLPLLAFWSDQFGVNIESVGVCPFGNEIVFTQGSVKERRFAAAYGHRGRIVAVVTFNHGKWLEYYAAQIERSAPFPPPQAGYDRPEMKPVPAEFPDPHAPNLARHVPDQSIASMLNRLGVRPARGLTWTQQRVAAFRCDHSIPVYREGERAERGEVILQEAVSRLGVSKMTVIRIIKDGLLPARQICSGAPYVIREADLNLPAVQRAIKHGRAVSRDPRQGTLEFQ